MRKSQTEFKPKMVKRFLDENGGAKPLASLGAAIGASPASLFNAVFGGLAGTAVVAKVASAGNEEGGSTAEGDVYFQASQDTDGPT